MTIKELIIRLLEEPMDSCVCVGIKEKHTTQHGECSGYMFDIDEVEHWGSHRVAINFSDCREGEWIYCEDDDGQDGYRCSNCDFFVPWYYDYEDSNYILDYKVCPNCRCRMKGADDE